MLSISEVSARSGLRASALRYYEEAGLLSPVARVSGRRHYDDSVLDRLKVIACARQAGFTIAELRELLAGEGQPAARWRVLAERKLAEIDELVRTAQRTRRLLEDSLACDCVSIERCAQVLAQP